MHGQNVCEELQNPEWEALRAYEFLRAYRLYIHEPIGQHLCLDQAK